MKIATICGSGDTFLAPIEAHWRAACHEVTRADRWPVLPAPDLLWLEWADQNLLNIGRLPKRCPIICRLHSFEAFTHVPAQADWSAVDDLVFVAPHVRDFVLRVHSGAFGPPVEGKFPPPDPPDLHTIPNGIDLARWPLREQPIRRVREGRQIAWVGGISHKKGPELFGQAALHLLEIDETATLHVAGEWQDPRYTPYLEHVLGESIAQRIQYHGKVPADAMPDFFRGMDVVLSTSPWESFQYAVAEGALTGCLPLVHDWPGARETYPAARHWTNLRDLEMAYRQPWKPRDAEAMRADIAARFRLEDRLADIDRLIADRLAKGWRHPAPTVSVAMIVAGDEPRFRAAVESVRGHVDEVVAHIDTRRGVSNVAVAEELGVDATVGPPPMFHHAIDFAAARNMVAERCTSDWIFILDADELVEHAEEIRAMLWDVERQGRLRGIVYDGVAPTIDCYTDSGLTETARDTRFHRREPERIRWRFPVHNQLCGYTRVFGAGLKIRSTYVGGLHHRVSRSVPPLEELWRLANEEPLDGPLVVNGIEIPKLDARQHAAFFLARMYKAGGDIGNFMRWAEEARRVCPDLKYAAPFWLWYGESTFQLSGLTAAEAVIDEGLRHHPVHPDLRWLAANFALVRWARDAADVANGKALTGVAMHSPPRLASVGRALKLLGMPIRFGMQETDVEEGGEE